MQVRKEVDQKLNERDRKKQTGRRIQAFDILEDEHNLDEALDARRRKIRFTSGVEEGDEYRDTENYINRENVKGKVSDWLLQPHVITYIQVTFSKIMKEFKEDDKPVYENRIVDMCTNNRQSLEVDFSHINASNNNLAGWLIQYPKYVLPYLDEVAFTLTCEIFPQYKNIKTEIFVRIKDLAVLDNLRDLRYIHLDSLIRIRGVVTKRSTVFPALKKAYFLCSKCGDKKGPFFVNGSNPIDIGSCIICQSNGPYERDEVETIYKNYQKITVQESPGTVPPGRIPRHKEVILINDLVDTVRPGEEVEVTGIYVSRFDISTNIKHCFPVFSTSIETNYIKRLNEIDIGELTDEDKIEIRKLAKDPNVTNKIIDSIAPSIFGHNYIKRALALAMFGGVSKDVQGKHRIRGDINVLLLGDPGVAKSQFLKYTNKVFHRSVYTTGKGASAVGLTAGVHKDPVTREWTLEGGALVLADKGICLIDEFDKMNDQDRTSIHEAMEQQSISISKAGIVTSLQARCSVIAAANPINGRYDNQRTFSDNVDLTDPILSRFDILCVIKDEVDLNTDTSLATFVINSHMLSHPQFEQLNLENLLPDPDTNTKDLIPQDILRKYIMYARKYIHPKLSDLNKNKISKFYADLRKESEMVGGITIAVRHLESLIRMAESHAKMHLRDYVRHDDIDVAIKVMLESFLQSQKYSVSRSLRKKFAHYLTQNEDNTQLLMNILLKLTKDQVNIFLI
jgi:DNA replication licensing factor MCM2